MRHRRLLAAAVCALAFPAAAQQPLVCPAPAAVSSRPCELFHFHLQIYRPEPKGFAEVTGVNQFASQTACERAREAHIRRNLAVVDYFKRVRNEQQYEPDRLGPCHCDLTVDKTSPAFLSDAMRTSQIRTAEDVRLRIREKLLDSGLMSDNELVRGLISPPPTLPILGGPKLVPLPAAPAAASVANSADGLRSTRLAEGAKPVELALDLPLADPAAPAAMASAESSPAPAPEGEASPGAEASSEPAAPPPAEEAAESFITYETQRIQNVLKASSAISDPSMKTRIFEACQDRIQLLSNLRALIEGSGVKSRLAAAARAAQSESERLALVSKLFGEAIAKPWAPADASEVILESQGAIDSDPERVLRDTAGRFNPEQKRRALYVLLARSQPTEEQQAWLITVVDSFLR
jgi:hypothetical protein